MLITQATNQSVNSAFPHLINIRTYKCDSTFKNIHYFLSFLISRDCLIEVDGSFLKKSDFAGVKWKAISNSVACPKSPVSQILHKLVRKCSCSCGNNR